MQNHTYKSILLILLLSFCETISAIDLTEFSKQLVNLYISTNQVPNNEDVVFWANADTLCYRVFLYSMDIKAIPLSGSKYIGKVKHDNRFVYLFGQQNDIFHRGKKVVPSELKSPKKVDDEMIIHFDPIEWEIFIDNKELKLNKQLTNSNIITRLQDGQFSNVMDSAILVQLEKIVNTYCGK